jgi:tetratricopeptide (TPR) repeat protein
LNKLFLYIVLFFSTVSNHVYSNSQSDSLRLVWQNEELSDSTRFEALDEYYDLYVHVMPDSVFSSINFYYDLAIEKKAERQIYRAFLRKGNIYRNQNKKEEALNQYRLARNVAQNMNNSQLEAIVIGNFGNIHLDIGEYFEAIKLYNEAKDIFVKENDYDGEGRMLTGIGAINTKIGNYDIALTHYDKALIAYKKADKSYLSLAIISMNIGLIHVYKKSFIKAESAFNDAIKILNPKNDIFYLKDCYYMLGIIMLELNDIELADLYATKSLKLNKKLDIEAGILTLKILKAKILYEIDKDRAVIEMEGLLYQVSESSNLEMKQSVYEFLYDAYKDYENWELSLKMHELLLAYTDSIEQRKNSFKVVREEVKNEYKAKLYENQLKFENDKAELKIKQVKRTSFMSVVFLVIISILLFFIILRIKNNTQRRNMLLREINLLKNQKFSSFSENNNFELNKQKIDSNIDRILNETDWSILNILIENPIAMNKHIAEKANLSIDGVGSSLRRMYEYFEVHETKYKKIALLHKAIKISQSN